MVDDTPGKDALKSFGAVMFLAAGQMLFYPQSYMVDFKTPKEPEFHIWSQFLGVQFFTFGVECLAASQNPTSSTITSYVLSLVMWITFHVFSFSFNPEIMTMGMDRKVFIIWPILCVFYLGIMHADIALLEKKELQQAKKKKKVSPSPQWNSIYVILIGLCLMNLAILCAQPKTGMNIYFPNFTHRDNTNYFWLEYSMVTVGLFHLCRIPVYFQLAEYSTKKQDLLIGFEWLSWTAFFFNILFIEKEFYEKVAGIHRNWFLVWLVTSIAFSTALFMQGAAKLDVDLVQKNK